MAHDLGKGWLGNFFEDFELGREQVCAPPRVIGAPESAIHIATTNDRQARFCGGEGRMHPLAVFHTVIGQTVRNISLNSPANLGYSKMIWHAPVFAGDEITTTIKIVGLGGVGSIVARYLAVFLASLEQPLRLVLIDGDTFEPSQPDSGGRTLPTAFGCTSRRPGSSRR